MEAGFSREAVTFLRSAPPPGGAGGKGFSQQFPRECRGASCAWRGAAAKSRPFRLLGAFHSSENRIFPP
ncbi:hypothetical protein B1812_14230 [Methylocystis bryophila]|uniref:Uncharacterized protein n=1 Tax=Methylocystis bryophila TaxID=655015 RepID=A0A1W6MWQ7_9HYPH|nr:hypothetical protein B1812_14230 [Methylocystis bryophila]